MRKKVTKKKKEKRENLIDHILTIKMTVLVLMIDHILSVVQ